MSTPFDNNTTFRKVTYKVQWAVNGILAVLGAYFAATVDSVNGLPNWYVVALAVLPVVWTYLGVQADTNTTSPGVSRPGEHGYGVLGAIGAVLVIAGALLLLLSVLEVVAFSVTGAVILLVVGLIILFVFGRGNTRF